MSIQGSCHCGAVRYTLEEEPEEAMACNCSICRRKGYLLVFSTSDRFALEGSRDDLTVYTFGSHKIRHQFCRHKIRHQFCRTCGCAPFGEGTAPNGDAMVAVNLRCAENVDLGAIRVNEFDGASL